MAHILKKYKKYLILGFIALFLIYFYSIGNRGEWVVQDVSRDTVLTAQTNSLTPSTIILEVSGNADDSIKLEGVSVAGGKIPEEIRMDYYRRKIVIRFDPYKAKKGSVKIKYYLP